MIYFTRRSLAALLSATALVALCACAPKEATSAPPSFLPTPTPFTYEQDIWSDRYYECYDTVIARITSDIAALGYPLDSQFSYNGIFFTQSTMETLEDEPNLVIRGIVRNAETQATNFVKLTYRLNGELAELPALDRSDAVQGAKFIVDLADHPKQMELTGSALNQQIDALDFYQDYAENIGNQTFALTRAVDLALEIYNSYTGEHLENIMDCPDGYTQGAERYIDYVGEVSTELGEDGTLMGVLPFDCISWRSVLLYNDHEYLGSRFQTSVYSSDSYVLKNAISPNTSAEEFIDLASYMIMDSVERATYDTSELSYVECEVDNQPLVVVNGVKVENVPRPDPDQPLAGNRLVISDLSNAKNLISFLNA